MAWNISLGCEKVKTWFKIVSRSHSCEATVCGRRNFSLLIVCPGQSTDIAGLQTQIKGRTVGRSVKCDSVLDWYGPLSVNLSQPPLHRWEPTGSLRVANTLHIINLFPWVSNYLHWLRAVIKPKFNMEVKKVRWKATVSAAASAALRPRLSSTLSPVLTYLGA